MPRNYNNCVAYSLDELQELLPLLGKDDKFAVVTFRPDRIKNVYVSKNPNCRFIGVQYWNEEVVISDGVNVTETSIFGMFEAMLKDKLTLNSSSETISTKEEL